MKSWTYTAGAMALLLMTNASLVLADDSPPSSDRAAKMDAQLKSRFAKADVNGDGQLTRDEAQHGMPKVFAHFDEIDVDKKGFVTVEQIEAFAVEKLKARKQQ